VADSTAQPVEIKPGRLEADHMRFIVVMVFKMEDGLAIVIWI
jgi:hypothetical protein